MNCKGFNINRSMCGSPAIISFCFSIRRSYHIAFAREDIAFARDLQVRLSTSANSRQVFSRTADLSKLGVSILLHLRVVSAIADVSRSSVMTVSPSFILPVVPVSRTARPFTASRSHHPRRYRVVSQRGCPSASVTPPGSPTRLNPEDVLNADQLAEWALVEDEVRRLTPGIPMAGLRSAPALVKKAFGWGISSQGFWQGDIVNQPATLARVHSSVEFLRAEPLAFNATEVKDIIVQFPSVLNLDVDVMQRNVDHLSATWPVFKGPGKVRTVVIEKVRAFVVKSNAPPTTNSCMQLILLLVAFSLLKPNLLGFSVDCAGDCISLCSRCWVRFS
jgi:hypothetical protein